MSKYRLLYSIIAPTYFDLYDRLQGAHRVYHCCHVQSPIHVYLQEYDVKTQHHVMAKKLKFVTMFTQSPTDYHAVHTLELTMHFIY